MQRHALRKCTDQLASQAYLLKTLAPGQSHPTAHAQSAQPACQQNPAGKPPSGPGPARLLTEPRSRREGGERAPSGSVRDDSALHEEVASLEKKLKRKEELLRVRSSQLVAVYDSAHDRDTLWGLADERAHPWSLCACCACALLVAVCDQAHDLDALWGLADERAPV
jgi:hypothetical protein